VRILEDTKNNSHGQGFVVALVGYSSWVDPRHIRTEYLPINRRPDKYKQPINAFCLGGSGQ